VVWVTVQSTADGGDELVTAHLQEHQKIRNIRRDPRVAVTIVATDRSGPAPPYLSIKGTARVEVTHRSRMLLATAAIWRSGAPSVAPSSLNGLRGTATGRVTSIYMPLSTGSRGPIMPG
jgi:Pyridoxamine 5'-phosphate oxidase